MDDLSLKISRNIDSDKLRLNPARRTTNNLLYCIEVEELLYWKGTPRNHTESTLNVVSSNSYPIVGRFKGSN